MLDPSDLGTIGKLDLFLMEEMLVAAGHVDTEYVKDLSQGFPVTGRLPDGDCGRPIPGGQRVHGTPGLGGPEPIEDLKQQCYRINMATLKSAKAKYPRSQEDLDIAHAAWQKTLKDIESGFAGSPIPVSELNLHENLLVDTFGIYEQHAGQCWKVRLINNFRRNTVNQHAWLPSKMAYNNFDELQQAARELKAGWKGSLELGKADFKSAFKTLPPAKEHRWLCYSLVFDPNIHEYVVIPIYSQAFGSIGAVVAWFRTSKLLQVMMEKISGLLIFCYVDDCFWTAPQFDNQNSPGVNWISGFRVRRSLPT